VLYLLGMNSISIYTDGSCYPNPGDGGWAYVILNEDQQVISSMSGSNRNTTNNRMELKAIIEALRSVSSRYSNGRVLFDPNTPALNITVFTDSKLVTEFNSKGKGKKNKKLIKKLISFNTMHNISYQWVKSHNGDKWNEFVDEMAAEARKAIAVSQDIDYTQEDVILTEEQYNHMQDIWNNS
jgi:ribonuclease HI